MKNALRRNEKRNRNPCHRKRLLQQTRRHPQKTPLRVHRTRRSQRLMEKRRTRRKNSRRTHRRNLLHSRRKPPILPNNKHGRNVPNQTRKKPQQTLPIRRRTPKQITPLQIPFTYRDTKCALSTLLNCASSAQNAAYAAATQKRKAATFFF